MTDLKPSRCVRRRFFCLTVALLTAAVATTGGTAAASTARADDPKRIGDIAVVDAYKQGEALDHGGPTTNFSLRIPSPTRCPGDSTHDQFRIETFIIPSSEDPTSIHYGAVGPDPSEGKRFALYLLNGDPLSHQLLQANSMAGAPGVITPLPPLSFAAFQGVPMPPGTYRIGVACTYFDETVQYWDTQIDVNVVPGSNPTNLQWRLVDVPDTVFQSKSSSSSGIFVGIACAAVALLAAGFFVNRSRRSARTPSLSKETK